MSNEIKVEVVLPNARATEKLGCELGLAIDQQAVIALIGPLGAGKTTFAKGLAYGLGIEELVNSPTFTMLNEYSSGRIPLYHLDLYRTGETQGTMEGASTANLEWLQQELEELRASAGVLLIEWADYMIGWIARQDYVLVELNYSTNETSTVSNNDFDQSVGRKAILTPFGEHSKRIISHLHFV